MLKLSKRASIAIAELLLNPPGPSKKAIAAAKRYKAQVAKGNLLSTA
jgi:hypothetical protein